MKVVIVTNKHVSYNPRVLKEADALSGAGHEVAVVSVCNREDHRELDEQLMSSRRWRLRTVQYRRRMGLEGGRWLWTSVRRKCFERVGAVMGLGWGIAELAHEKVYRELTKLAMTEPADLYIAHHVEALGAAAMAARCHQARMAFDAEDFHSGEHAGSTAVETVARTEYLERKYFPGCHYISAASDGIAEALMEKYGVARPTVILNVFPLEPLPRTDTDSQRANAPSLYWYSQVIGPARGLEEAVKALSLVSRPCQLHLRGQSQAKFLQELRTRAKDCGVQNRVFFHKPAPPERLIALASEHDIGLALENGHSANNFIAVSNKILSYMTAGLAIVATDTPGQRGIMRRAEGAGVTCRRSDPASLAEAISGLLESSQTLAAAKRAARRAAESLFNWEREKQVLLGLVESCRVSS